MEATGRTVLYVCSVLVILTGEHCVLCCCDGMLGLSVCVGATIAATVVAVFIAVSLVGRVKLRGE